METLSKIMEVVGQSGPTTLLLIALVVLLRVFLVRWVTGNERLVAEARRRWLITIRNSLLALFLIGLLLIWAPQLRTFTTTLVLIAAAVAIATKELVTCLAGAVLHLGTDAYALGDRIEIAGVRGKVVDHNLLTTTVLEIGPGQTSHQYTGRAMIIPNCLLFQYPLTNETYTKTYVLHVTRVPLMIQEDWQAVEKILLEAAWDECRHYIEDAKRYMKRLEGRHWLDSPSVEPRVTLQLQQDSGRVDLLLRVPCPPDGIARLEQAILRRYLSTYSRTQAAGRGEETKQAV